MAPVKNRQNFRFIGERAKRARHSQVCSIENRNGECGSTLYVGLSRIVRNLIQKSTV